MIVLVVIAGAFYFKHHAMMSSTATSQTENSKMQPVSNTPKSLSDFLSMTGTLKCTFSNSTNNSSGTVYVSNGKMRGDFQSTNNGTAQQSHMVNDGTFVYFWVDGQNGTKMSLSAIKNEEAQVSGTPSNNSQPQGGMDMHQKSIYSCSPWVANSSVFTPPASVTFTDYSAMMQKAQPGSSLPQGSAASNSMHGTTAECAECNQAPAGAARNQCLSALHCQ